MDSRDDARADRLRAREVRLARYRQLCARLGRYVDAGDELEVMEEFELRLARGLDTYGPLDVEDGRDYPLERAEELVDADVYGAIELVRRKRARVRAIEARPDEDSAAPVAASGTGAGPR